MTARDQIATKRADSTEQPRRLESVWGRRLLIALGSLFVGLAAIGVFIPLLPTTPFLLLAAACYVRSSSRCYNWLLNHRWLGPYLRNYREGKGTTLTVKIVTLVVLWLTIGYSAVYATDHLVVRAILAVVAIGVTIHLIWIPTYRGNKGRR